jgi:hypothetical protein
MQTCTDALVKHVTFQTTQHIYTIIGSQTNDPKPKTTNEYTL